MSTAEMSIEQQVILRAKIELKRKMLQAAKEFGLPFYQPHDKQTLFHLADAKFRAVFAGNRFGKSQCGVAEDCAWVLGERMWMPKGHPGRTSGIPNRPVKILIVCADWDKCEEIFTCESSEPHLRGKIWKNLSRGFVKNIGRNSSGKIDRIEFLNGSLICFDTVKSFMTNPLGAESSDWDAIHIDEPIPEKMWKAISRGLIDRNGRAWFTLTNLEEPWIYEMFFPSGRTALQKKEVSQYLAGTDLLYKWAIIGSIYDNPYLDRAAIAAFEDSLTIDERQCRLHGLAMHLSGLVYKEFKTEKHIMTKLPKGWSAWNRPPRDYTLHFAIDTHPRKPQEVLFAWSDPANNLYFAHEIFEVCLIPELAQKIKDVFDLYPTHGIMICEPGAWIDNPVNGKSLADCFIEDFELPLEMAPKDLHSGVLAVKKELARPDGIYFSPELPNFFGEIMKYSWDKHSDRKDKPVDKDDHAMECFYRLILSEPQYIKPENYNFAVKDEEFSNANLGDI